jgi:hypothetical protein
MKVINLPIGGKFVPCHQAHGMIGISSENGLVLMGSSPGAVQAKALHALELTLRKTPDIIHWPMSTNQGFHTEPDQILDLTVDRISVHVGGEWLYADVSDAIPGDLFVSEDGMFAIGKRMAPGAPNAFDLSTRGASDKRHGRGLIYNSWHLTGHRGDEVVFEVEMGSV